MKPFNLKEYLKDPSKEVITRDGRKVRRILCTDARGKYPVIALIGLYNDYDCAYSYTKDGSFSTYGADDKDLFFAPEKHKGWINIYLNANRNYEVSCCIYKSKENAEEAGEGVSGYITTIKIEWEE